MDKKLKQLMIEDMIETNKIFGRSDMSPEEVEQLVGFIERGDRLWERQNNLEYKYGGGGFLDGEFSWGPGIDIPEPNDILKLIQDKIVLINGGRKGCMERGVFINAEPDYNKLEKAYYNLKVDVESFVRIHQLKKQEKS